MSDQNTRSFLRYRDLVERPKPSEELELSVQLDSYPTMAFFFMLAGSTVIGTLGLLANSAAVIIGAMIIAPLMSPIVSMSYGLVAGKVTITLRALLAVAAGTILTIGLAFLITEAIGWKLAGSEIVARMKPSLLDLGVAAAAGASAAYAYIRPNVSAALPGVAIAVALVPPLCTVGIAMSLGAEGSADVGLALDGFSGRGPMLLYLTNIVGIVLTSGLVFYVAYFRRRLLAVGALLMICAGLTLVVPPLGVSMDNLLVRNQVHRSMSVESNVYLPEASNVRFRSLGVQIKQGVVYVRANVVASPSLIEQETVDALRSKLEEIVGQQVVLEFGVIPEEVITSGSGT
ncbi:MAG: DUF389 domain-containing protein [Woeseiaceae bacterium]|nr:DUF389 domain-containing protein [Woeseiaceae bacterium]